MAKKPAKKAAKKIVARRPAKAVKPAVKAKPAKPAKKKPVAKAATAKSAAKSAAPIASAPTADGKLTFNHAMIYVKDVNRALGFYRDLLGFKLIEDFRYDGVPVYARLSAPGR